jgi:anti-anti-sigma factor
MSNRLEIDVIEPGAKLALRGRLDAASTPSARPRLHREIDSGSGELVLHLADLEIWDGAGLGVLVGVSRRVQRAGRRLVLTDVGARELRLLRVARLTWTSAVHPAHPGVTPATRIERHRRSGSHAGMLARA